MNISDQRDTAMGQTGGVTGVAKFCGACGQQRALQSRFCMACGAAFADDASGAQAIDPVATDADGVGEASNETLELLRKLADDES